MFTCVSSLVHIFLCLYAGIDFNVNYFLLHLLLKKISQRTIDFVFISIIDHDNVIMTRTAISRNCFVYSMWNTLPDKCTLSEYNNQ